MVLVIGPDSERSEGESADSTLPLDDTEGVAEFDRLVDEALDELTAEEAAEDEFALLLNEAAAVALSKEPKRRAGDKATVVREPSRWVDSRPQWRKVGFTLRVIRQECNCGSIHSVIEGLYRNDEGRAAGTSRMLRLTGQEELDDFSEDKESPQWVETLTQGSVMCVECAGEFGFTIPATEQPAEIAPYAEWPWAEGERA